MKINLLIRALFCASILLSCSAKAAYVLTPTSTGLASVQVGQGDSFDLDIFISSDSFDTHNSAIFSLDFSRAGLELMGYSWADPYQTDSVFEDSIPNNSELPLILDEQILQGAGFPDDVVDVLFSNIVPNSGVFSEGLLLTLTLQVPLGFGAGDVTVDVVPDTIANGFDEIATVTGDSFVVTVVPIPVPGAFVLFLSPILVMFYGRFSRLRPILSSQNNQ